MEDNHQQKQQQQLNTFGADQTMHSSAQKQLESLLEGTSSFLDKDRFRHEMDSVRDGIDRDLNLKESSGLVNPLGLKEASTYAALKTNQMVRKDSDTLSSNDEKNFDDPKPIQTLLHPASKKGGSASAGQFLLNQQLNLKNRDQSNQSDVLNGGQISLATFNMANPNNPTSYNLSASRDGEDLEERFKFDKVDGGNSCDEYNSQRDQQERVTSSSHEDLTLDMLRQSEDKEIDRVREALQREKELCVALPTGSQLDNHIRQVEENPAQQKSQSLEKSCTPEKQHPTYQAEIMVEPSLSLDQFRANNAALQEIMMQLQPPVQANLEQKESTNEVLVAQNSQISYNLGGTFQPTEFEADQNDLSMENFKEPANVHQKYLLVEKANSGESSGNPLASKFSDRGPNLLNSAFGGQDTLQKDLDKQFAAIQGHTDSERITNNQIENLAQKKHNLTNLEQNKQTRDFEEEKQYTEKITTTQANNLEEELPSTTTELRTTQFNKLDSEETSSHQAMLNQQFTKNSQNSQFQDATMQEQVPAKTQNGAQNQSNANYRQVFKPNSQFVNAAQTMLESKENYNYNRGAGAGAIPAHNSNLPQNNNQLMDSSTSGGLSSNTANPNSNLNINSGKPQPAILSYQSLSQQQEMGVQQPSTVTPLQQQMTSPSPSQLLSQLQNQPPLNQHSQQQQFTASQFSAQQSGSGSGSANNINQQSYPLQASVASLVGLGGVSSHGQQTHHHQLSNHPNQRDSSQGRATPDQFDLSGSNNQLPQQRPYYPVVQNSAEFTLQGGRGQNMVQGQTSSQVTLNQFQQQIQSSANSSQLQHMTTAVQSSVANGAQTQQLQNENLAQIGVKDAHKEIMRHFDDIPIKQIRKMPGYQTGENMKENEAANSSRAQDSMSQINEYEGMQQQPQQQVVDNVDDDESGVPLHERAISGKWKIRLQAYKEINTLFWNDFTRFESSKNSEETPNGDPTLLGSFDTYGPLIQEMIKDQNLIACYEALSCMLTYVKFAFDIKSVTFASHTFLMEKIQTNKGNFREITRKILLKMIHRDQATIIYPELTKRIRSKQLKVSSFALHVLNEAFVEKSKLEDLNQKVLFRAIQDALSHSNKELRDLSTQILKEIYMRCADEPNQLIQNCRSLRPVQKKELKDVLASLQKIEGAENHKLFESGPDGTEASQAGGLTEATSFVAGKDSITTNGGAGADKSAYALSAGLTDEGTLSALNQEVVGDPIDLLSFLPENFSEIAYVTQINVKRKSMAHLNAELEKHAPKGRRRVLQVKNKDYTLIFNTVIDMLGDKNMLVFLEAIKTVELLSDILGPLQMIKQAKAKILINLLAGKYGETKTAVIAGLDKAIFAMVRREVFSPVQYVDMCINQIASTHKNPRVKQLVLERAVQQYLKSLLSNGSPNFEQNQALANNLFRLIKEKLLLLIQKDTSASVRDAAVTILVTFKMLLPNNDLVDQSIQTLPKYRVTEISKKVEEFVNQNNDKLEDPLAQNQGSQRHTAMNQTMMPSRGPKLVDQTKVALEKEVVTTNGDENQDKEKQKVPKFAKSFSQRVQSAKNGKDDIQNAGQTSEQEKIMSNPINAFVANMMKRSSGIAEETKPLVALILNDLAYLKVNDFKAVDAEQIMEGRWERALRAIGPKGILESKNVLLDAILDVFSTPGLLLSQNQAHVATMCALSKRLLISAAEANAIMIDSSMTSVDEENLALENYFKIAFLQNVFIQNNQGETCQMLQVALNFLRNPLKMTETLRKVVNTSQIFECPSALQIIEAVYVWFGLRLDAFLQQGMEMIEIEELTTFGLRFLQESPFTEQQRQALVQIMIKFRDLVSYKKQEFEQNQTQTQNQNNSDSDQNDEEQELPSESRQHDQLSRQQTPQVRDSVDPTSLHNKSGERLPSQPQTAAFKQPTAERTNEKIPTENGKETPTPVKAHSQMLVNTEGSAELSANNLNLNEAEMSENEQAMQICELIDSEFEMGLLKFKDLAQKNAMLSLKTKSLIFNKLLAIVGEVFTSNTQEQKRQALALKALMWMKEETLGVEDCFLLTQKVMSAFARSEINRSDTTVEVYLLNFWSKDLSIRDLCDRIAVCVSSPDNDSQIIDVNQRVYTAANQERVSKEQLNIFNILAKWLQEKRLQQPGKQSEDEGQWQISDLRKIVLFLAQSICELDSTSQSGTPSFNIVTQCIDLFGTEKVKEFAEIQLMHHNELSESFLQWLTNPFSNQNDRLPENKEDTADDSYASIKMPKLGLGDIVNSTNNLAPCVDQSQDLKNGSGSARLTPRTLLASSQSYRERRDQYKHSTKKAKEEDQQKTSMQYNEIMNRLVSSKQENSTSELANNNQTNSQQKQQIDEASGESGGEDTVAKVAKIGDGLDVAGRGPLNDSVDLQKQANHQQFHHQRRLKNDPNSAENQQDQAMDFDDDDENANEVSNKNNPMRNTNSSAYYRSMEKKAGGVRYTPLTADDLADDAAEQDNHEYRGDDLEQDDEIVNSEEKDETLNKKRVDVSLTNPLQQPDQKDEIENKLEASAIKKRHWEQQINTLQEEKDRIASEKAKLILQKDEQSDVWKSQMLKKEAEYSSVQDKLAQMNSQYEKQVIENQNLKEQLNMMQAQHKTMMDRFEQIERQFGEKQEQEAAEKKARELEIQELKARQFSETPAQNDKFSSNSRHQNHPTSQQPSQLVRDSSNALYQSTAKKDMIVSVRKLQRIEETFAVLKEHGSDQEEDNYAMVQKIQELLLSVERNVDGELAQPLIIHYSKLKLISQRMSMLQAIKDSFDTNEDVLVALSTGVHKAILNFLLRSFAHEKQILENQSLNNNGGGVASSISSPNQASKNDQNELLREAMPQDLTANLSTEERQYLRVLMRCIMRITRALHSEQPDLVRAFDVLLEMQKMFVLHPPENLSEELPCLDDFDFIYKGMKDVSDKLIDLQPDKVESFLSFAMGSSDSQQHQNAFIKYLQRGVVTSEREGEDGSLAQDQ